ncbi:hypothetical protein QE429_001018 [Bacillus sp. SORGH_AS 510]|nr:hypothetical protein [Bacillus sp. SORGH_AS_0510]
MDFVLLLFWKWSILVNEFIFSFCKYYLFINGDIGVSPIRHSLHTRDYIEQEEWITHAAVIFEARL